MTRLSWVWVNTLGIILVSLVSAYFTRNPNWAWNIPLGIIVGIPYGYATWYFLEWVRRF